MEISVSSVTVIVCVSPVRSSVTFPDGFPDGAELPLFALSVSDPEDSFSEDNVSDPVSDDVSESLPDVVFEDEVFLSDVLSELLSDVSAFAESDFSFDVSVLSEAVLSESASAFSSDESVVCVPTSIVTESSPTSVTSPYTIVPSRDVVLLHPVMDTAAAIIEMLNNVATNLYFISVPSFLVFAVFFV